jgi:hypothetical protein
MWKREDANESCECQWVVHQKSNPEIDSRHRLANVAFVGCITNLVEGDEWNHMHASDLGSDLSGLIGNTASILSVKETNVTLFTPDGVP